MTFRIYFWSIILISVNILCSAQILPDLEECEPTFKMLDASGKIPSGILSGNTVELGSYVQCLGIKEKSASGRNVRGKYCMVKANLPLDQLQHKIMERSVHKRPGRQGRAMMLQDPSNPAPGIVMGWCIPDHCSINNITDLISPILGFMNSSVSPLFGTGVCQVEKDLYTEFTASEWGTIAFFIFIGVIIVISTIYDVYLHYAQKKPAHIIFIAFSVKSNGQKLLAVSNNPQQLPCLHGIRFLSMMWVIYGHRIGATFMNSVNPVVYAEWNNNTANMYVANAPVSVDTFFVLSGLLVAYGFLLAKDKGINFNIPMYYLHRYIRLTPAIGAVILIHATILMRFGSGPYWPLQGISLQNQCKENWWPALLYIQNYYNPKNICLGQSWYLSIDTQLFILSPILLLPLWRWPKFTMIGSSLLVIASMVISFAVSYHYSLSGSMMKGQEHYMDVYYFPTHTRFGPWVMGIMLGYYIFRVKKRQPDTFTLHPAQICLGWIVTLTLLLATLYAGHNLFVESDRLGDAFFNGLHRHGWSLGVCLVIYLCTEGYGGPINAFLSWSLFQVLGRFTYTMYLTHYSFQLLKASASKTSGYFTDFNAAYEFWGDFAFTLFLSICLTLSFESPMLTLEKVLFGTGSKTKQKDNKPTGQTNGSSEKTV